MTEKGQHLQSQRVIPKRPRRCTPRKSELPNLLLPPFFSFSSLALMLPCGATKGLLPGSQLPCKPPASHHPPPDPCSAMTNSCRPDSREKSNSPRC